MRGDIFMWSDIESFTFYRLMGLLWSLIISPVPLRVQALFYFILLFLLDFLFYFTFFFKIKRSRGIFGGWGTRCKASTRTQPSPTWPSPTHMFDFHNTIPENVWECVLLRSVNSGRYVWPVCVTQTRMTRTGTKVSKNPCAELHMLKEEEEEV